MVDEEQVKSEIIEVAKGLIQQFGINKVTMKDIAQAAGKGKSTLYYYFKNKEEILDAVIEDEMHQFYSSSEKAVQNETGFENKLRTYINTKVKTIEIKLKNYAFLIEVDHHYFDFRNYFTRASLLFNDREKVLIESILKCGVQTGKIDPDKVHGKDGFEMAEILLIAIRGLEMEVFLKKKIENIETKTDMMIEILLNGLK
ncbi:TetR/AcrR family transcriptional regulator [Membranihabitans marinus]|uniref:TetR/AcrR family transcriptional regulator n=1 Tax=Membranihabitans marinus TaxID=1227546 RepID=UPI001F38217A|nr:TetR/AcrR family transcriptional regulator [Membranihabitans marinus]